jgi:hypothetical protein
VVAGITKALRAAFHALVSLFIRRSIILLYWTGSSSFRILGRVSAFPDDSRIPFAKESAVNKKPISVQITKFTASGG